MARKKITGIISKTLIVIGLFGVFVPHIGFLIGVVPTLDIDSHSIVEIISGISILIGAFILRYN